MSRRICFSIAAALCGLILSALPAQAGMSGWTSVKVDHGTSDATFSINFGHTPNFDSVDAHGRLTDSFQILIAPDPVSATPFISPTTVVRGDEIRFNAAIPIRNGAPPDFSDSHSGGWGSVRGTVPFSVSGTELTFTAPLSLLGAPDGRFAYDVSTFASGFTKNEVKSQSVPLPPAFAIGMMMLATGIGFSL